MCLLQTHGRYAFLDHLAEQFSPAKARFLPRQKQNTFVHGIQCSHLTYAAGQVFNPSGSASGGSRRCRRPQASDRCSTQGGSFWPETHVSMPCTVYTWPSPRNLKCTRVCSVCGPHIRFITYTTWPTNMMQHLDMLSDNWNRVSLGWRAQCPTWFASSLFLSSRPASVQVILRFWLHRAEFPRMSSVIRWHEQARISKAFSCIYTRLQGHIGRHFSSRKSTCVLHCAFGLQ